MGTSTKQLQSQVTTCGTNGDCGNFAIACARLGGWPLWLCEQFLSDHCALHIVVLVDEEDPMIYRDAEGFFTALDVDMECGFRPITEEEVFELIPLTTEEGIRRWYSVLMN